MRTKMRDTLLFRAFTLSLLINALAGGAGMLSDVARPLRFLSYLAQVIAALPAFVIGWLIKPHSFSLIAIVLAGVEGLIFSVVFYTALLWLMLLWLNRSGKVKAD